MVVAERTPDAIYLRGWEERVHHSSSCVTAPVPAAPRASASACAARRTSTSSPTTSRPRAGARWDDAPDPASAASLRAWDPFGYPLEFFHEMEQVDTQLQRFDLHRGAPILRFDHVNLHTPRLEEAFRFWASLGFRCSEYISTDGPDERITGAWLLRKPSVHDVALTAGRGPRLHHTAFWVGEPAGVLRACDQLAAAGACARDRTRAGRHGVSNAFFVYLRDPDGHRIELYSCDYYTGDPDLKPLRWSVNDIRCRSFWGTRAPDSWYDESTSILGPDGRSCRPRTRRRRARPAHRGDGLVREPDDPGAIADAAARRPAADEGRRRPPQLPQPGRAARARPGGAVVLPQAAVVDLRRRAGRAAAGRRAAGLRGRDRGDHRRRAYARRRLDDAQAAIGWYAPANDFGVHDFRWADRGSNVLAKGQDGYTPIGPAVAAADVDPATLRLSTRVNGEVVQDAAADELLFGFGELVADLSRFMTLERGDVILTGTPAGAGVVEPGDVVEVELDGAGAVRSTIVEASEPLAGVRRHAARNGGRAGIRHRRQRAPARHLVRRRARRAAPRLDCDPHRSAREARGRPTHSSAACARPARTCGWSVTPTRCATSRRARTSATLAGEPRTPRSSRSRRSRRATC